MNPTIIRNFRYLAAVLLAIAAAVVAGRLGFGVPNAPGVLLLPVAYCAYRAGLGIGLTGAAFHMVYSAAFFSMPGHLFHYDVDNLVRTLVIVVVAPAMATMLGTLRREADRLLVRQKAAERELVRLNAELEQRVTLTRANLDDALESIEHGLLLCDADDRVVLFNRHFLDHYPGIADVVAVGMRYEDMMRTVAERGLIAIPPGQGVDEFVAEAVARHRNADGSTAIRRLVDGRVLHISGHAAHNGGMLTLGTDVTELLKTEQKLAQAQKMEAIGQLTGGVAHDFNNLLAVILGRLEMLEEELADKEELRSWVRSSIRAAQRGATLTKSLLAFSRQQALQPVELDLNAAVGDMEDMLRRTLGEAYEFRVVKAPDLWRTEADPGQLQNALINLVVNARDAMPVGGAVTVSTANIALDIDQAGGQRELRPGEYVLLSVSDTGMGMARGVIERVFEPFFTTKDVGKGSGLGLSMVYGFVKQSGGHVTIHSESDRGTTVGIYLPRRIAGPPAIVVEGVDARSGPGGGGTILVVEDNDEMRVLTRLQLEHLGYTVLEAAHGPDGLRVLAENRGIDLLLTDVIMPKGMSGPQLADQAIAAYPHLKIVFMSGYNNMQDSLERTRGSGPVRVLQKPFGIDELAAQIRAALQ
jgi:signal transduction histidine kinase/CheY-like chemotaxis protein